MPGHYAHARIELCAKGLCNPKDDGAGVLAGHLVFLVVLLLKPSGLFARTR